VAVGVAVGVSVDVAFSASSPDGVPTPGLEGSGVRATVSSCGVHVVVRVDVAVSGVVRVDVAVSGVVKVDVAVSGAVGRGVRRLAVPPGSCASAARTVVVAERAVPTATCPVDGVTRLGVTVGDTATLPVAVASALAVGGPFCGPQPAAVSVGEAEGLAAVSVGVAVLSADNLARGPLVWPRPWRRPGRE
jgi:hypothetical protein